MSRPTCACTICSQEFTRKSSGKRHNINIHGGTAKIVRYLDYIIGRIEGKYKATDPLFFRKNTRNNGTNFRSRAGSSNHFSSNASYGDSIAVSREENLRSFDHDPSTQAKDGKFDFSDLDYLIALASRVLKIKNLRSKEQKSFNIALGTATSLTDNTHGTEVNAPHARLFDNEDIFGYSGLVCPDCAYYATYQLEFREGLIHKRILSIPHDCNLKISASYEKETKTILYNRACDSMRLFLPQVVNLWLKNNPNIFAIKLPDLYGSNKGLIEAVNPYNSSKSICIPFSKDEIQTIHIENNKYWATRAVANDNKATSISEQELLDFILRVGGSTFGVFEICSRRLYHDRCEYYLIYSGKEAVAAVRVHDNDE